jgi:hypothetical protein
MTTEDGQYSIKAESPSLFIVRERTGSQAWDWKEQGRFNTQEGARKKVEALTKGR